MSPMFFPSSPSVILFGLLSDAEALSMWGCGWGAGLDCWESTMTRGKELVFFFFFERDSTKQISVAQV